MVLVVTALASFGVVGVGVVGVLTPFALLAYVRTSIAESFRIPSNGMHPGLPTGSVLWIDKRACQELSDIRRGDVVVFEGAWGDGHTYNFIWRVIGLPGEHVVVDGHLVSLDGVVLPHHNESVVGAYHIAQEGGSDASWPIAWPVGDRARSHILTDDLVVPAGHVYVLGDNRYDAVDGRSTGPVPLEAIVGCAFR